MTPEDRTSRRPPPTVGRPARGPAITFGRVRAVPSASSCVECRIKRLSRNPGLDVSPQQLSCQGHGSSVIVLQKLLVLPRSFRVSADRAKASVGPPYGVALLNRTG